jgi:hypothetical protein
MRPTFRRLAAIWVVLGLVSATVSARKVTEDDADFVIEQFTDKYEVRADGTFTARFEFYKRIMNETGRQQHGTMRLRYNADAERLRVLVAEVLTEGESRAVPSEYIEDKPLASNANGFDQQNQVLVAFPDVKVGSVLHLVYEWEKKAPALPNFFSQRLSFYRKAGTLAGETEIVSALPLHYEENDPFGALDVLKDTVDGKQRLRVRVVKPIYEGVVDEFQPLLPWRTRTWVFVASTEDFAKMAQATRDRYEAVVAEPLPELFQAIVRLAERERTTVDKINAATAALAERVRYMGDWRPRDGGYVPRSLKAVADSLFGDCKDLSTVLVAMLRRIGLRASIAWVHRGADPEELPHLPGTVFNHAIVHVEQPNQKPLWVDPTNFESFAQGVPYDIAGRQALVLGRSHIRLETIPAGVPDDGVFENELVVRFRPDFVAAVEQRLAHKGWAAVALTGRQLRESKASIDRYIATALFDENQLEAYEVEPYDLTSRIVRDREFRCSAEIEQAYTRTSAGFAFTFPRSAMVDNLLSIELGHRASDYLMGRPYRLARKMRLENLRVVGNFLRGCRLRTPWFEASRSYRMDSRGFTVVDEYRQKAYVLSAEIIASDHFRSVQRQLRDCFDRIAVVFTLTPQARRKKEEVAEPSPVRSVAQEPVGVSAPPEALTPRSEPEPTEADGAPRSEASPPKP